MALSLNDFVEHEVTRLDDFKRWYLKENKRNPEQYPLTLPNGDEGLWDEMFADFMSDEDKVTKE